MLANQVFRGVCYLSICIAVTGCAAHRQSHGRCCERGHSCGCATQGGCQCGQCGTVVHAIPNCAASCAPSPAASAAEPAAPVTAPPPPSVDAPAACQPQMLPHAESSKPLAAPAPGEVANSTSHAPTHEADADIELKQPTASTGDTASDPCARPDAEQDPGVAGERVVGPQRFSAPDDLPAPITADETAAALPDAIDLQQGVNGAEKPVAPPSTAPANTIGAPQAFEPESGARALNSAADVQGVPQPAAPNPYRYSFPGTPAPKGAGVARARSYGQYRTYPQHSKPQYDPKSGNLGELYQPYYSNGLTNQFRNAW